MLSKIELASNKVNASVEYGIIGNETVFKLPFIYLTQTEKCLPSSLSVLIGDMEICNCDVIVLSFKAECAEVAPSHVTYLFDAQSTWSTGRNELYVTAMKRKPGYHYYIFLDDDVVLEYNSFTPREMMNTLPLKSVQRWLLEYEPAVGVLDYSDQYSARYTLEGDSRCVDLQMTHRWFFLWCRLTLSLMLFTIRLSHIFCHMTHSLKT